jgi:hypothetical protein
MTTSTLQFDLDRSAAEMMRTYGGGAGSGPLDRPVFPLE